MEIRRKTEKKMSKKKKALFAVLFVVLILFIGTTVHSLFLKDTTESKSLDLTEVVENETYADVPKDNSTPDDYTPEENISICQNVMQKMKAWTSKTEGTATADVLFINYTQNISASKVIKDKSATQQTASTSTLLSTGQQRTFKDGAILIRNAKKVKSMDDIIWEDDFTAISKDTYAENYGKTPFAMTNYIIDETTIIKSKQLDSDKSTYKFEFELKPDESTVYYKRQMKTEGGASEYPVFHSVKATVTMDEKWRPLKIHYSENYDISIAVVGSVTCQGEVTETFADFEQVEELPDEKLVDDFIKNKYDKNKLSDLPAKESTDISKYITDMFEKNPYYTVNIDLGKEKLNLNMFADIKNGVIKVQNDELFAAYADNKVYINYENIKVSCKAESIFEAVKIIAAAVDLDTKTLNLDALSDINLNNINLDGDMSGLLNNVKLEQDDNSISVKFNKDDFSADIKVALDDETVRLDYADVAIKADKSISKKLGVKDIAVSIKTAESAKFAELKGYNDISKAVSLLKPWINTVNAKGVKSQVKVKAGKQTIKGTAVLSYNPFGAKFTTKISGVKITAKIIGKTVYISTGNVKVRCLLENVEPTVKQVFTMVGIKADKSIPKAYTKIIKELQNNNTDIKNLIKKVQSIDYKNGYLNIKAKFNGLRIKISVAKNAIKIQDNKLLDVNVKITKKYKKQPKIRVQKKSYVTAKDIVKVLTKLQLYRLVKSKGIILDTEISAGPYRLNGILTASYDKDFSLKYTTNIEGIGITLIYKDKNVYVSAGNIHIRATEAEVFEIIKEVLKSYNIKLDNKALLEAKSFADAFDVLKKEYIQKISIKDVIGNIKTFKYSRGSLVVGYNYDKKKTVTINLNGKTLTLNTAVAFLNINAKVKIHKIYTNSLLIGVDKAKYSALSDIINVISTFGLEDVLTSQGIDTDVTLKLNEQEIKANVKINYDDKLSAFITTEVSDGKTTIPVELKYIDNVIYVSIGNVYVSSDKDDLEKIIKQLLGSQNISTDIATEAGQALTAMLSNITIKDIVYNVESFQCTSDTLKLNYKLNGSLLSLAISGRTIDVRGIKLNNTSLAVGAKINNTKTQDIALDNKDKYVDFVKTYDVIMENIEKIKSSKAFGLNASVSYDGKEYLGKIIADIATKAIKVIIPVEDVEISATYINDVVYIEAEGIKICATKDEIQKLINENNLSEKLEVLFANISSEQKLSLEMLLNIKEIKLTDNKIYITYQLGDKTIEGVIGPDSDSIFIDGLKLEDKELAVNVSLTEFYNDSQIHSSDYDISDYTNLGKLLDFLKGVKENPGVLIKTVIDNKPLVLVYEGREIYADYNGLKLKSDDGSLASIVNAVLKIYDVDITPVLEAVGIKEDEKDINLDMFKPYTDPDALKNLITGGNFKIKELLTNIKISENDIIYFGKISGLDIDLKLYDGSIQSQKPDGNSYIDISTMDSLLKGFGKTASNLNFDITAKASLGLDLGLININLKDVPITAKLKAENNGVYGKIHLDVPYMSVITNENFGVPATTTETVDETAKTKTEIKTTYSVVSDSQNIVTDLYITPEYIYIHKNVSYKIEKTVTTTKYKKILIWIKQSSSKVTETTEESKDFYIKRTYKEMQEKVLDDLCFALNMTDSIRDRIVESGDDTDVSDAAIENIFKAYTYDAGKYKFNLDLSSLTNNALGSVNVDINQNNEGFLNNLYVEGKIYSLISIKLDADLNNIGDRVDIGFDPDELEKNTNYK